MPRQLEKKGHHMALFYGAVDLFRLQPDGLGDARHLVDFGFDEGRVFLRRCAARLQPSPAKRSLTSACFYMRQGDRHTGEDELDMAGNEVVHRLSGTLVRHMHDIDLGHVAEQFTLKVRRAVTTPAVNAAERTICSADTVFIAGFSVGVL